jgi:hypothetical protein
VEESKMRVFTYSIYDTGSMLLLCIGMIQSLFLGLLQQGNSMQQIINHFRAEFKETGDYWLDSGIMSLFRAFNFPENMELANKMGITIREREFVVEGTSEEAVTSFIKEIVDNLVNTNYITPKKNKDIWYDTSCSYISSIIGTFKYIINFMLV